jgi:hypothetical protein
VIQVFTRFLAISQKTNKNNSTLSSFKEMKLKCFRIRTNLLSMFPFTVLLAPKMFLTYIEVAVGAVAAAFMLLKYECISLP